MKGEVRVEGGGWLKEGGFRVWKAGLKKGTNGEIEREGKD